jgi:hypothetical protein
MTEKASEKRSGLVELRGFLQQNFVESQQDSALQELIDEFRVSLRNYFLTLPHHGLSDMSQQAVLENVSRVFAYRYSLSVFKEVRKVIRCVVPYKGWKIPPLRRNEDNTIPWGFNWPVAAEPSAITEKKIVSDSQENKPCEACDATGTQSCVSCDSKGRLDCENCSAQGVRSCAHCQGVGTIRRERQVQKFRACTGCGMNTVFNVIAIFDNNPYTRARSCAKCHGTGKEPYVETETYNENCPACKTRGRVRCNVCSGRKFIACASCMGRGKIVCKTCSGCKSLVSYLELQRNHSPRQYEGQLIAVSTMDALTKSHQQPFTVGCGSTVRFRDGNPMTLRALLCSLVETSPPFTKQLINELLRHLSDDFKEDTSPVHKTAWDLEVQIFSTAIVRYSINKRKYHAIWDSSLSDERQDRRIYAHDSVVSQWCRSQVKSIQETVQSVGIRDAAMDFKKLDQIAKLDKACELAIQSATSATGLQEVARASGKVVITRGQQVLYSTSGIILVASFILLAVVPDKFPFAVCFVTGIGMALFSWRVLRN